MPVEATKGALEELGIGDERVAQIMAFIEIRGERAEVMERLNGLGINEDEFEDGVTELDEVMRLLEIEGLADAISADMKIVRGLDYYTGTIFEFNLPEYPGVGSVCGGGRYENLAGYFTEQKLPGVGGSIGLTRLFYVLNVNELLRKNDGRPNEYAVVPITESEMGYAMEVARELRENGASVTLVGGNKRLGDKLKYAASVARKGIVLGETEVRERRFDIKEFK